MWMQTVTIPIIYPKVMCISLAMDVKNVPPARVSIPMQMFQITVAITSSFTSQFITNLVDLIAREAFVPA